MKISIGDRVKTVDGVGLVVGIEHYSRIEGGISRFCVRLDTPKYFYPISCYWPHEVNQGA